MTQEQAANAIHAAKMAQKMAMERNLDKIPANFLLPQLDISKINNQNNQDHKMSMPSVTIEPTSNNSGHKSHHNSSLEIRRGDHSDRSDRLNDDHQQQQHQHSMMSINNNSSNNNKNNNNINNYNNKEESSADERNLSDDESSIAVN